jgi:RNA polymerase sigma-70 factor (ECF subfamily)
MTRDDKTLIRACLQGDDDAYGVLIERYQETVFNTALRLVGDYDEARDVAQDVFVKAYEALHEYRPEHKFFSWIYKMTVNHALNTLNRRKRQAPLDINIASKEQGPDAQYDKKLLENGIQDALAKLPVNYRVIIILRYFADLSYHELGYVLEIPEKTVKSRLFTARQRLTEIMTRMGLALSNG